MDDRKTCPGCGGKYFVALGWKHAGCIAPGVVANGVNAAVNKRSGRGAYPDTDERRKYMREKMRKRRAEGRA